MSIAETNAASETSQELSQAPKPKPPVPVVGGPRGLELRSLEEMWRFAQYVAASGLAPKGIESPQAIIVALQMGAEVGLTPMASLQNIAVVNGRPSIWGDAMLAVCRGSGLFDEKAFAEKWYDDQGNELPVHQREKAFAATCAVRRLPDGAIVESAFNLNQAKEAGLLSKGGPWKTYPARMLQMRARSFALRDGFSDVLRGFKSAEETRDTIEAEFTEPAPAPRKLADLTERLTGNGRTEASETMAPGEVPLDTPDEPEAQEAQAPDLDALKVELATLRKSSEVLDVQGRYAEGSDAFNLCVDRIAEIRGNRGQGSNTQKTAFETNPEGVGQ